MAPATALRDSGTAPAGTASGAYFERDLRCHAVKILPGEYHVAADDVALVTVLGSCVSACLRDTRLGIGGMNHFLLPDVGDPLQAASASARYGAYAMEVLVNELLKRGARRDTLEAKVFGGGNVMAGLTQANVGERNATFVLRFLRDEAIRVAAHDLMDVHPRKVAYFPRSGRALVRKLTVLPNDTIVRREQDYRARLSAGVMEGDVELFT
jgi:chemotaxis protein CheD